jgi:hypothetical protein
MRLSTRMSEVASVGTPVCLHMENDGDCIEGVLLSASAEMDMSDSIDMRRAKAGLSLAVQLRPHRRISRQSLSGVWLYIFVTIS